MGWLTRTQLLERVVPGCNRNTFSADRLRRGDIARGITDHDDATFFCGAIRSDSTPRNRSTQNELTQKMIAAVTTKRKTSKEIHATQLDFSPAHHVSGSKTHVDLRLRVTKIQNRRHTRTHKKIIGARRLIGQGLDVDRKQFIHLGFKDFARPTGFLAAHEALYCTAHDRPVGHAIESKLQGLGLSVSGIKGARHRTSARASRAQKGPVDIKKKKGRLHDKGK